MFEIDEKTKAPKLYKNGKIRAKTAHTLNPVWFIVYDPTGNDCIEFNPEIKEPGLTNVASTTHATARHSEPPENLRSSFAAVQGTMLILDCINNRYSGCVVTSVAASVG